MSNKYLEKVAQMQASGSVQQVQSSSSGAQASGATGAGTTNRRGFRSLRMGQHTTPDDLMPNPQKMDIRVK